MMISQSENMSLADILTQVSLSTGLLSYFDRLGDHVPNLRQLTLSLVGTAFLAHEVLLFAREVLVVGILVVNALFGVWAVMAVFFPFVE